jgi:hypothetical protein
MNEKTAKRLNIKNIDFILISFEKENLKKKIFIGMKM